MRGAVMVVQITPFRYPDEKLDLDGLRQNTEFLIEATKGGPIILTPAGSTGEFYSLTDEEYKQVVNTVVEVARGKLPIVAGASGAGTKATLERVKYAEDLGVDGVMVVLPFYFVPTEEGLYLHYKRILESTSIGVVIYNNPDVSKIYMRPSVVSRLANEYDNLVAVKENTPDIATLYEQVKRNGNVVPILQGRGEVWYALTAHLGIKGFVSPYANFMPDFCIELLNYGINKQYEKLWRMLDRLEPYEEFVRSLKNKYGASTTILPPPYADYYMVYTVIKVTMDLIGLKGGSVRLPLINLDDDDKRRLEDIIFAKLGLKKIRE